MQIQRVKFKDIEQVPHINIKQHFKQDFFGTAPAPFIGRFGYPDVNIGILSPQETGDASHYDSPQSWSRQQLPIGKIAGLRYSLVNSRRQGNVRDVLKGRDKKGGKDGGGNVLGSGFSGSRFLEICQEAGMSRKGVEVEVSLAKPPKLSFNPEKEIIPFGPGSEVRKARITANTKVDSRVENVVSDTDLKAAPAIIDLYRKGFEESFLNKLISVGCIGMKKNRKLVPTRWSITAVDDTLGKELIQEIKQFPPGEYLTYFSGGWGNYYLILFFPEVWSYELFETYLGYKINPWSKEGHFYSTDYESFEGRKDYAEECAGGYYACRLPVLEKMEELKRQHSCLALRFITSEYNIPLGVWVCREASRKAVQEKPLAFSSQELMLKYAQELIRRKFGFELDSLLKESKLLKEKKEQRKLAEF